MSLMHRHRSRPWTRQASGFRKSTTPIFRLSSNGRSLPDLTLMQRGILQTGECFPSNPEQGSDYAPLLGKGTRDTCGFVAKARSSVVFLTPHDCLSRASVEPQPVHAVPAERACLAAAQQVLAGAGQHQASQSRHVPAARRSTLWVVAQGQSPHVCSSGLVLSLPGV
jgi:hypothetical protein